MNQFPPRHRVSHWDCFKFFRKFAKIFASQGVPPLSIAAGINNYSGKFATGINDTGGKFASGVNDTGGKQWEQLLNC
jgi:hypothetical protein